MSTSTQGIKSPQVGRYGASLRHRLRRFARDYGFVTMVLTPIMLWFVVFSLGPILYAFWSSLRNVHTLNPSMSRFVGLQNFIELTRDQRFIKSMVNVVRFVLVKGAGNITISLTLALLLERLRRGRNVYLFFAFMPVVISEIAVAMLFIWFYDPQLGLINHLLTSVGLPAQSFLRSTKQALYSVVLMDLWKNYGQAAVIFLAALLDIPSSYYEAAKVDGASAWQSFRHITVPMLRNAILLISVLIVIDGVQKFTSVSIMTGGGPADSSIMPSLLVYREGLGANNYRMGYASAIAFVMFAVILIVTTLQRKVFRSMYD
ncbi:MAG: carbohydrate ABC transporter permease [Anaerolineae bacterium]